MAMASPPMVGAFRAPPVQVQQPMPEVIPMRRGRPTKPSSEHSASRPSPSPLRGTSSDPFAALDTAQGSIAAAPSADELSNRFPTLDQFSILHDTSSKFDFDHTSPGITPEKKDISQRVTEALADEAFALPSQSKVGLPSNVTSAPVPFTPDKNLIPSSLDRRRDLARSSPLLPQSIPPQPVMVSTGTMTSPPQPSTEVKSSSSIHRFPPSSEHRSTSQPNPSFTSKVATSSLRPDPLGPKRPGLLDHRSKSQTATVTLVKSPASSRPSLESQRPLSIDLDNTLSRSRSVNTRPRPSSAYLESNLDYLRDREMLYGKGAANVNGPEGATSTSASMGRAGEGQDDTKIASDVDFLRAMEEEEASKKKEKRSSSGSKHVKRASLPSISLSGTKTLLAGKFGDAFRRFETNTNTPERRTISPSPDRGRRGLTPIAGSEATEERSDDGNVIDETEDVSPEMRRELERRRLSQEERRVATAAAEYKKRLAYRNGEFREKYGGGESNRAAAIQTKVQSLLNESNKALPVKTGDGNGQFAESERAPQTRTQEETRPGSRGRAIAPNRGVPDIVASTSRRTKSPAADLTIEKTRQQGITPNSATLNQRNQQRPAAPPKPKGLRTGGQFESPVGSSTDLQSSNTTSFQTAKPPDPQVNDEDWETNFSKRYPSLSGLEMVETVIDKSGSRSKEV